MRTKTSYVSEDENVLRAEDENVLRWEDENVLRDTT